MIAHMPCFEEDLCPIDAAGVPAVILLVCLSDLGAKRCRVVRLVGRFALSHGHAAVQAFL